MTRITFLVPTFNRAAFLGDALDAILSQKTDEDDLLVIDDGSTDSTPDVVRSAGSRVRYVRQDNAGKSVALNRGLAETDAEFVFICDDDDRLRPGAVELLFNAISGTAAAFVFGCYTRFEERSGRDLGVGYWPDLGGGSILRHLLEDAFVMQNASLIRRSALLATGPFSESINP
jgi:glycosyltransferase involved in cell wall biosynthesis